MRHLIAMGVAALAVGMAAHPAPAADVVNGSKLAAELCAPCHDIGPDGAFKQYPPSFASIAVYRSKEQIRSRIMVPPVHSAMPQMSAIWRPGHVDDLVAYIASLERNPP